MVRKYEGNIPKSGKSIFEFAGIKFCHRSVKKDGSDLLLSTDGWIIGAFPRASDRSFVLDKLGERFEIVREFLNDPEAYNNKLAASSGIKTEGEDNPQQEDREDNQHDVLPEDIRRVPEGVHEEPQREVDMPCFTRRSCRENRFRISDAERLELEEAGFKPW